MSFVDEYLERGRAAQAAAVTSIDVNPENSARALELSKLNGVAPVVVDEDLEHWDRQTKANLAGSIIDNNPHLQRYINQNPMAPRVSNDDWGQLDGVTNRVARLSAGLNSTLIKTFEAFIEGTEGPRWINRPETQEGFKKLNMGPVQNYITQLEYNVLSAPLDIIAKLAGGATSAAPAFTKNLYGNVTGDWNTAERLGREAGGFMEYLFNRVPEGVAHGPVPAVMANRQLRAIADSAGPYLRAGEEPPPLINQHVDQIKREQTKIDLQELDDLFSEVQKSTTRERAPDMFADLIRQQTNANIYIPFDAVAKLYGEKLIEANDGLLGWVPDINAQVRTMSMNGGDIVIPLADWLAKVDPNIAKELHDNIRVRKGGFTIEEGRVLSELTDIDVYHGSPHSFEAFSMEGVGTGQGAQSFGHGLYFAENKAVAESYRPEAKYPGSYTHEAFNDPDIGPRLRQAKEEASERSRELRGFVGDLKDRVALLKRVNEAAERVAEIEKEATAKYPSIGGNLYRARIRANPEDFLDWDKPFSEQSPKVQQILQQLAEKGGPEIQYRMFGDLIDPRGNTLYGAIGRGITYEDRSGYTDRGDRPDVAASKALREAGIPGIRYLDQGSRQLLEYERSNEVDRGRIKTLQEYIEGYYKDLELAEEGSDAEKALGHHIINAELRVKELEDNIKFREGQLAKGGTYNYVLFDDALVEILDRNGEAIQAVRNQAGLEPLAEGPKGWQKVEATPQRPLGEGMGPGEIRYYGAGTESFVKPTELYTRYEAAINTEVDKILDRIAPGVERQGVHDLRINKRDIRGIYINYTDRAPMILWSLTQNDPIGTARHEAIHFLRRGGFFTEAEWGILKEAAEKEGWIEAHDINSRYPKADAELKLEEAIAEQYSKVWSRDPNKVTGAVAQVFEKLRMALVQIMEAVEALIGRKPTVDELFAKVESGEIGSRIGAEPTDPRQFREPAADRPERKGVWKNKDTDIPVKIVDEAPQKGPDGREYQKVIYEGKESFVPLDELVEEKPKAPTGRAGEQLELDVTRQSDKELFSRASAIGMTVDQYKRYLKLIEKRNIEDIQKQRERALALEKKRQSAEWKEESDALEDQVRADLSNRPDIAAANYFRYGELYGEKLDKRPALDRANLTKEQEAALPKQWVSDKGIMPDDAAGLFGFPTVDAMIEALTAHEAARGNLRPGEFFYRQVKAETERRMIEKHGELDSNILRAAEDHVLGQTQMDLLHEETVALGMRSGSEITFTKADVQKWIETRFNELPAKSADQVKLLNEAGKAGKAAELALLKGDFAEAFRQKQRQYFAAMMAKEAKDFAKETERFERLANRFSKREGPKAVEQEFTDQIQDLLRRAGLPVRRSAAEMFEAFDRAGYTSLDDFVQKKIDEGHELAVQPWLYSQIKPYENMTVEETREFRTAINNLNHIGRDVRKIEVAGEKADFDRFRQEVIDNIKSLPLQPKRRGLLTKILYGIDSELVRMEELVKDLDLRKELGPLFNVLIRPMAEAKHTEFSMLEALAKRFNEMRGADSKWMKTLDDTIPQDFFKDPNGTPFSLTRETMIGIMLNFGNRSNIEKFTRGWAKENAEVFEHQLRGLFDRHATKADWDFVQNLWDVFEMWRPQANEMYYQLSGVPPKWINAEPFVTPHGTYRGGYFPVLRDSYWADTPEPTKGLFANYHRATPTNHYTKERTGSFYPVEFEYSLEQVAGRMQQEIHDIAYRRQIMAAKKVLDDKSIMSAIRQHYGAEYADQMPIWLRKIASHFQVDEKDMPALNAVMRRARYNLVVATLPLNLRVIMSPDIGLFNPVAFSNAMLNHGETSKIAYEKSREIPHTFRNMDRDFREQLDHIIEAGKWDKFTADATKAFFWPALKFSQQFRMTTFVVEYNKRIAQGLSEGDAVAMADSLVRERHGAAGIADLPSVMTGPESRKVFTVFYGWFNTMYNWQRQIPGQARRGEVSNMIKTLYGGIALGAVFGAALFNQQKEGDSWPKIIAKALLLQPLSTIPFLRDAANYYFESNQPRSPIASLIQTAGQIGTDIKRKMENKPPTKPIQHAFQAAGLFGGVPGTAQIGRTSQFLYDVNTGKQRPRNTMEYIRGIISGEARLKK